MIDALPLLLGPEGYQISRSVRLRSSASAYLNRTPASAGNRQTWTWSGWVKRGTLGAVNRIFSADDGSASTNQDYNSFLFNSSDQLVFGGNLTTFRVTTAVYRDPSAWYHIVFTTDTTQATAANRFKLYVNGAEVTAFGTSNNPSQNTDLAVNASIGHYIGSIASGSYFDGYLTEINFIDGQALTPSSFGETDSITGVWKPKKYTGTYGTNGFYLNFSDNSAATAAAIGKDYSGNGNNWTPNNISVTAGVTYDSMLDVPTQWADGGNGRGNYAVLNPLQKTSSAGVLNIVGGNLNITTSQANMDASVWASMAIPTTGKFYWEVTITGGGASPSTGNGYNLGIASATGSSTVQWISKTGSPVSTTYTTNDVLGFAVDSGAGTIQLYKNNVAAGAAQSFAFEAYPWLYYWGNDGSTAAMSVNFGQRPFAYTPPSGFKALNTLNLPTPTILKGNQYFNAVLWTGDNASTRTISGVGFQPDLVWVKSRSNAQDNLLLDSVRAGTYNLVSNATSAEFAASAFSGGAIDSVASDGFSLLRGSSNGNNVNQSTYTYVGWNWKEGATQGFDIVTYTGTGTNGQTIAHSLGVTPAMVIYKCRETPTSVNGNWLVWHRSISQAIQSSTNIVAGSFTGATYLNLTSASGNYGFDNQIGENGKTYVAYCFAAVAGYSAFGSYTGNGSADGPFVFCGFRPRYFMMKRTDAGAESWFIYDTTRSAFNASTRMLAADLSSAELDNVAYGFDFLANGIKIRNANTYLNASGGTYIFMAFAETSFKFSLGR